MEPKQTCRTLDSALKRTMVEGNNIKWPVRYHLQKKELPEKRKGHMVSFQNTSRLGSEFRAGEENKNRAGWEESESADRHRKKKIVLHARTLLW